MKGTPESNRLRVNVKSTKITVVRIQKVEERREVSLSKTQNEKFM